MRIKYLVRSVFLVFIAALAGCSVQDNTEKYSVVFDDIKNAVSRYSPGRGGIYWVSDDAVVLDAIVTNEDGVDERGLYQVNMDGSYIRLISVERKFYYTYCFNGEELYVRSKTGQFNVLAKPEGYKIVLAKNTETKKGYKYSRILCRMVKRPNNNGYYFLQPQDGAIQIPWNEVNEKGDSIENPPGTKTFLTDDKGNVKQQLDLTKEQISTPRYFADREVYFGYRFKYNCGRFWWLYREGWKTVLQEACFDTWIDSSSKIALSTRAGVFIEHHTRAKKYRSYLYADDTVYPLETSAVWRAAVAPDGCRVAYGVGAIKYGGQRFSHRLKIFDSCQFMKDQGESE